MPLTPQEQKRLDELRARKSAYVALTSSPSTPTSSASVSAPEATNTNRISSLPESAGFLANFGSATKNILTNPIDSYKKFYSADTSKQTTDFGNMARGGTDTQLSDLPGNVLPSAGRFVKGIYDVVRHPIDTAKSLGGIALGAAEKLIPGEQEAEKNVDNVVNYFKERYGNWDNAKRTIINDPVGLASDVATVASGGAAAATKLNALKTATRGADVLSDVSTLSKAGKAGDLAGDLTSLSKAVDPLAVTARGVRSVIDMAAKTKVGQKLAAPFKSSSLDDVTRSAQKLGVDLPLSARTSNRGLQAAEAVQGGGVFGGKITEKARAAYTTLAEKADDIGRQLDTGMDNVTAGTAIKDGVSKYVDDFNKAKSTMYDDFGTRAGSLPAKFDNTQVALKELIAQTNQSLVPTPAARFLTNLQAKIKAAKSKKGGYTFDNIKATRTELGQMLKSTDTVATGSQGVLKRLYAALSDDMDDTVRASSPELATELEKLNEMYKTGITKINDGVGKFVMNTDPEKIVSSLMGKNNATRLAELKEIAGPQFGAISSAWMTKMFKSSLKDGKFNVKKFVQLVEREDVQNLKVMLGEDGYQRLQSVITDAKGVDAVTDALGKGRKIAEGSQTGFIRGSTLKGAASGGFAAGMLANPPAAIAGAIAYIVGDLSLRKILLSPKWNKYLTEGIDASRVGSTVEKVIGGVKVGIPKTRFQVTPKTVRMLNELNKSQQQD